MQVLTFSGAPADIGEAFGRECREQIHEFYRLRIDNAISQALQHGGRNVDEGHALAVASDSLEPTRAYHPDGFAELEGIARGADMPVEKVLAMNGLTDIRDVLAWGGELESLGGCSSFVIAGDHTASGKALCGQTWDLATDNMAFVVGVVREPKGGPQTRCLTTVGCLSLIGINADGIAVGTTNIRTLDARPGVTYLSIIHKALSQRAFEPACEAITSARRAGAHYYYVVGPGGRGAAIECTATRHDRTDVTRGFYVHCNHCLVACHAEIEGHTPAASSHARQARLEQLISDGRATNGFDSLKTFLGDRANGENAICRNDYNGISSNGAVVMEPESGAMVACRGLPDAATWIDMTA